MVSFNNDACSIFSTVNEYYISGESYGGKYVPAIARYIMDNKNSKNQTVIPLKGISIGDGFTYPLAIMSELTAYAYNLGLIDF